MPMEWQLQSFHSKEDHYLIEAALQEGWEPFAVTPNRAGGYMVWLKKIAYTERGNSKASDPLGE